MAEKAFISAVCIFTLGAFGCSWDELEPCPDEVRTVRLPSEVVFNRNDGGVDPLEYGGPAAPVKLAEVEHRLEGYRACGHFAPRDLPTLSRIEVRVSTEVSLARETGEGHYACGALRALEVSNVPVQVRTFGTRTNNLQLKGTVSLSPRDTRLLVGAPCAVWAAPPCELGVGGAGLSVDFPTGTWLLLTPGENRKIAAERVVLGPCPEESP